VEQTCTYTCGLEMGLTEFLELSRLEAIFQKWVGGVGCNVFRDTETYVVCDVSR
jgi:hypothetical protein